MGFCRGSISCLFVVVIFSLIPPASLAMELQTTYTYDKAYDNLASAEAALRNDPDVTGSRHFEYQYTHWYGSDRVYAMGLTPDYFASEPIIYTGGAGCSDCPILDQWGNDFCEIIYAHSDPGRNCSDVQPVLDYIENAHAGTGCTFTWVGESDWEVGGPIHFGFPFVQPEEIYAFGENHSKFVTFELSNCFAENIHTSRIDAFAPGHCAPGHTYRQLVNDVMVCRNPGDARISVSGTVAEPTDSCSVENPCHPTTGDKTSIETDFGSRTLPLVRYYHSYQPYASSGAMGQGWSHSYTGHVIVDGSNYKVMNEKGDIEWYTCADSPGCSVFRSENRAGNILQPVANGWELHQKAGETRVYDSNGKLTQIRHSGANFREVTISHNANGSVSTVVDQAGRSLVFNYNSDNLVDSVTLPGGDSISYQYALPGSEPSWSQRFNLVRVTREDLTERVYHYEDEDEAGNPGFVHALTGITDEKGVRYSTYSFDDQGRVVSSQRAGGAGLVTLNYTRRTGESYNWSITEVTMPSGQVVTYDMEGGPFRKVTSIEGSNGNVTMTYDPTSSWRTAKTDREGKQTTYVYDNLHETSRTEAAGTADARVIETDWDNTVNRVSEIREPGSKTSYTHNSRGQVMARTITDTNTLATRTWTYTYLEAPLLAPLVGQVETVDGPRTDVSDITTYEYYTTDHAGGDYLIGDLKAVVNALGHRTDYLEYDFNGRPLEIRDANNVLTVMTYHPRGWISTRTTDGQTTSFTYDKVGNLTRVTQPDGSYIDYEYDDAHRLDAIADNFNNRIEFTLDAAGNHIEEKTYNDIGILTRQLSRVYNSLNQLDKIIDGNLDETDYGYDGNGNRSSTLDANLKITSFEYDALDRLVKVIDAISGGTLMGYDDRDNLVSVTDPLGSVTQYTYDGLDNQTQLDSPDTGITTYDYDTAGNLIAATDARNVRVEYGYDALNRLTDITYPDSTLDVGFTYDVGTYGKGRLASMTDAVGTVSYSYDARGNLLNEIRNIGTDQYVTSYVYNNSDRLTRITYPSGMVIDYTLDAAGRVTAVDQTIETVTESLASNILYEPFGPVTSFIYGNGLTYSATFDQNYELDQLQSGSGLNWIYGTDAVGNILIIDDQVDNAFDQVFTYDGLYRLDTASGDYGSEDFDHDANGNRTRYRDGVVDDVHAYENQSNRLATNHGWVFSRDEAGNRTQKLNGNGHGYLHGYSDHNRLAQTSVRDISGDTVVGEYGYDGRGQRVVKNTRGSTVHFAYGPSGELLGEYDADSGPSSKEYVYLNGQPIAVRSRHQETTTPAGSGLIVDNGDVATSSTGQWNLKTGAMAYGGDHREARKKATNTYRWTWMSGASAPSYKVWVRWVSAGGYAAQADFTVSYQGGAATDVVTVSQKSGGGQWYLLGTYSFTGTGGEYVEVSAANVRISADAVKFEEVLTPVVFIDDKTYFIHTDHLGAPRRVSDDRQIVVWRWDSSPFGNSRAIEDPDGDSSDFTLSLRFPGQYYDAESGLHYNYFRTYDPSIGRYVESDPAGLGGGLNTFAYTGGNPLTGIDPLGLAVVGKWIEPPRFNLTNVDVDDWALVSPSWSWWGYARFIRLYGHAAGYVNLDVHCTDECRDWDVHDKIMVEVQGSYDVGPNLYAIIVGSRAGPVAGAGMNIAIGGAATLSAEHYYLSLAEETAGPLIAATLQLGPTAICLGSSPEQ